MSDAYLERIEVPEHAARRSGNEYGRPGPLEPPEAYMDYPPCRVCHEAAEVAGRYCVLHAPAALMRREDTHP